jgi:Protein of unknown function (DUF3987)/Bifunctional DNA primase/polymerase, N-terminal
VTTEPLEAARLYTARNWSLVPVPYREKRPSLPGWQNLRLTEKDLAKHFNGQRQNIGVILGKPSGNLVDVDLDCREAVELATTLLPETSAVFGHSSNPASHRLYTVTGVLRYLKYRDIDGSTLVELRTSYLDERGGFSGYQTIVPPSTHPSGELVTWDRDGPPKEIEAVDLREAVTRLAAASLLVRHWPNRGSRHDASLALCGGLIGELRWSEEATADFVEAVCRAAGDEEASDRRRDAETTATRAENEYLLGWPTFAGLVGDRVLSRLLKFLDPEARDNSAHRAFGAFGTEDLVHSEREWPPRAPQPVAPAVPSLPPEMVPAPLYPWIADVSERLCVPMEMIAAPALVVASALVGRKIAIRPGRFDDFTVVPNLWGAVIARPGWLKSPAIKQVLGPLGRLIAAATDAREAERDEKEAERDRLEAEIDGVKREVASRAKQHSDTDDLKTKLTELRRALRECIGYERRYMTQDPTVEKLGELLRENPRGLLLCRDELAGWLRTLERSGREGEREFYLEAWAGDQAYTFDRISRGTVPIPALTLSILGGIQPGKLRRYIEEAEAEGSGADGLLQRFQVTVWPDTLGEWRRVDRWPSTPARQDAFRTFEALDRLEPALIGAEFEPQAGAEQLSLEEEAERSRDWRELPYLRFEAGAQALHDAWRDTLEARLRGDELATCPAFESHLSKYRSLMPSLALLCHLLEIASGAPVGPVTLASARLAAAWCDYLEQHARKIYAAELNPGLAAAGALAKKIVDGSIQDDQSVRDVYRNHWSGLSDPERVQGALRVLEGAGWVRVVTQRTEGRPTEILRLHPELRRKADA